MNPELSPLSNARLKEIVKLQQKKYRDVRNRFIVSGVTTCQAFVAGSQARPEYFIINPELSGTLPDWVNCPTLITTDENLARITGEPQPQGMVLISEKPGAVETRPANHIIYLHQINDPGNLGTIIRSAVHFGLNEIWLAPESCDPFQLKAVRSSSGYISHCRLRQQVTVTQLQEAAASGYQLTALQPDGETALSAWQQPPKTIFCFGSEAHGLPPEISRLCRQRVRIEGSGTVESLNLGISAALVFYRFFNLTRQGKE